VISHRRARSTHLRGRAPAASTRDVLDLSLPVRPSRAKYHAGLPLWGRIGLMIRRSRLCAIRSMD
jgi:hypothetical protein